MTKYLPIFPEAFDNIWAITDSIMKAREKQGITGTDFVGRLMELIKDVERDPNAPNHKDLSRGIIVAQVSSNLYSVGKQFIFVHFGHAGSRLEGDHVP